MGVATPGQTALGLLNWLREQDSQWTSSRVSALRSSCLELLALYPPMLDCNLLAEKPSPP